MMRSIFSWWRKHAEPPHRDELALSVKDIRRDSAFLKGSGLFVVNRRVVQHEGNSYFMVVMPAEAARPSILRQVADELERQG